MTKQHYSDIKCAFWKYKIYIYTILSRSFGQHEHFTTVKKLNNWIFLLYAEINHFLKSGGIILYGHSYTQNMLENWTNFDHQNCANL